MANAKVRGFRLWITWLVGFECLFSLALLLAFALGDADVAASSWIYLDGVTVLMLPLVSFVGLVVSQYSIRYLDGEASQGRYFRWLGFTIGAVSWMVISGNLLQFFVAWVATSSGLHQLLMHYRERTPARRAAWTKFAISRLGDLFIIGALILTFQAFGTWELSQVFAQARELSETSPDSGSYALIGWLLALGAITKSAQFPFHFWLPETMETPTPVSALMHAGIVNAGGFLIIRMSPLMALAPSALVALALIGGFTACFAGVVMMTQSSIKRSLAYSTIAQMGFMMLQCGLGAFPAAMLHIVAHSLYKAHAFLGSGSVLNQASGTKGAAWPRLSWRAGAACWLGAAIASALSIYGTSASLGLDLTAKPGAPVLIVILGLALTTWSWRCFSNGDLRSVAAGAAGIVGFCLAYLGSYLLFEKLLASTTVVVAFSPTQQLFWVVPFMLFIGLFWLHAKLAAQQTPDWIRGFRVHAANGFYVDGLCRRAVRSLVGN